MIKNLVRVWFWNIDSEYHWKNLYLTDDVPTVDWARTLYDGNNSPEFFELLGTINVDEDANMVKINE